MSTSPTERPAGFWSYVHDDDDAMRGRIVHLAHLIKAEFDAVFGQDIDLFVDRKDISWGDKWRRTIDSALNESVFFIPIITPRFFLSNECRRELVLFSQRAKARNIPELVLPILYIKVPDLSSESEDDLKQLISETQYVPFFDVRRLDEDSEPYNLRITEIVEQLIAVIGKVAALPEADEMHAAGKFPTLDPSSDDAFAEVDQTSSLLDVTADIMDLVEAWTETMGTFETLIRKVGEITANYHPKVEAASKKSPVAVRFMLRKYAEELMPTAEEFRVTGLKYAQQISDMNEQIESLIVFIGDISPKERHEQGVHEFLESLQDLAANGRRSSESVAEFSDQTRNLAEVSKEVRRPLSLLDQGNQNFLDGQDLLDDWVRRIEDLLDDDPESSESDGTE